MLRHCDGCTRHVHDRRPCVGTHTRMREQIVCLFGCLFSVRLHEGSGPYAVARRRVPAKNSMVVGDLPCRESGIWAGAVKSSGTTEPVKGLLLTVKASVWHFNNAGGRVKSDSSFPRALSLDFVITHPMTTSSEPRQGLESLVCALEYERPAALHVRSQECPVRQIGRFAQLAHP